jgi:hypothetical protein
MSLRRKARRLSVYEWELQELGLRAVVKSFCSHHLATKHEHTPLIRLR